jgi:hypothetical protein
VQSQDVIVVASLCAVYQSDEVARTLVALFESQHQAHRLLNQLLFREIKQVTLRVCRIVDGGGSVVFHCRHMMSRVVRARRNAVPNR